MPNWIEGSIKIRGSYENVEKFFLENLNVYNSKFDAKTDRFISIPEPKESWCKIIKNDDYFEFDILDNDWAYVEGSTRAFISGEHEIYFYREDNEEPIAAAAIHQAWSFNADDWVELAKKYSIDIRLWGLESGLCFGQEIEIDRSGKLIVDKDWSYEDWRWDAPIPWLGG